MTAPLDDQPAGTDPVVDRVNELTTTFFDALGMLLIAAGLAYGAWLVWGLGWALCAGGVAITCLSYVAQFRGRPRPPKVSHRPVRTTLPGPSHPGNLHIAGGE
jgi:hypothetical protein